MFGLPKETATLDIASPDTCQCLNPPFEPFTSPWIHPCHNQPWVSRPKFRLETNSTVVWLYAGGVSSILPYVRFGTVSLDQVTKLMWFLFLWLGIIRCENKGCRMSSWWHPFWNYLQIIRSYCTKYGGLIRCVSQLNPDYRYTISRSSRSLLHWVKFPHIGKPPGIILWCILKGTACVGIIFY